MNARVSQIIDRIKFGFRDIYWEIYGKTIENPGLPCNPKSLLFVCKGNICRSPFAEHLARRFARNGVLAISEFYSAGLEVSEPSPAPKNVLLTAENFGVRLCDHRSREIDQKMVQSFDMILAMELSHFRTLARLYPVYHQKIYLLSLFDPSPNSVFSRYNIEDPFGRSQDEFQRCFQRIKICIEALSEEIKRRNG